MLRIILSVFVLFLLISSLIANTVKEQTYLPDGLEILEPEECTRCNLHDMEAPKNRIHRQGKLYDDETLRLMKEHARYNPNAPAGTLIEEAKQLEKAAPPLRSSFDGLNQITALRFFPPDTQIAIGPNHILQATNGGIRLSSKTNTNVSIVGWNTFFAKSGVFLFDPKLFYDPIGQRFFVTILEFRNTPQVSIVRFAVSQSSSPTTLTQGWCRYSYSGKVQGTWADFPSMGMNEKWIAIHTNNFKFSDNIYARSLVKVADKSKLVNNSSTCPKITFSTFNFPFPSAGSGTIQFAQTATPTSLAGTPLFAASILGGDSTTYDLWRVIGTGKPSIVRTRLTGRPYTAPPDAKHKGPGIDYDTGFPAALHTVVRNGIITFSFTTGCNLGSLPNESCIRVVQISPTDAGGNILFERDFGAGADKFFWMPAVTVNSAGDMAVIFQQSGKNGFLGVAYTGKKASATTLEPFRILQLGKCNIMNIDGDRNRTGDYAGIAIDPSDNRTFWGTAEYSTNMSGRCIWSTRIGKMSY